MKTFGIWFVAIVFGVVVGDARGAEGPKLESNSRVIGGRRVTITYSVEGAATNRVCLTWEKQVGARWELDSRDYYVGGKYVLYESEFDENGVAGKLLIRNGDELVGVVRKGKEIVGILPREEIEEIKQVEKHGAEVGAAIGSAVGKGKDGRAKTPEEIMKAVAEELEENKKRRAEEKK